MNNSVFSESHRKAGECLKIIMQHHQISIADGMEMWGISRAALTAYRAGANTIPHKMVKAVLETVEISASMRASFTSAVYLSVIEAYRLYGGSHVTKKRKAAGVCPADNKQQENQPV